MLRILFVDDEQKMLDGLKRTLRPLRQEWRCEFAQGGAAGLKALDRDDFDVVVTDVRMPVMDGLELLKQVKVRHPHLLRIVLSGQSEFENLIKSSGVSHQYLAKPCAIEELRSAIERAFLLKRLLSDPFLIELASQVEAIPSVSSVYLQLERLLQAPSDFCPEEAGNLIAQDMGLCAKALQVANSGCFARIQVIADPTDAAGLLGFSTLQSLARDRAFREFEPQRAGALDMDKLWRRSLQCSRLAQEMAGTLGEDDEELRSQAGAAGLLCNVGQLVMAYSLPEQYGSAAALAAQEGLSEVEAERRVFQTSHAELGAYIMALWNIPDLIVEAIAYHHDPAAAAHSKNPVLTAVYMADLLAGGAHLRDLEAIGVPYHHLDKFAGLFAVQG